MSRITVGDVEAALGQATEAFAAELAAPGREAPAWTEFEWTMARAAAVLHGVAPLLSVRSRWNGPEAWLQFGTLQFQQTRTRHQQIEQLLARLDARCRISGIGCVALKGSALHALGLYHAGERPMADIDLLVQERDLAPMTGLLRSLAYAPTHSIPRHRIFEPPKLPVRSHDSAAGVLGEDARASITIELHTHIAERLPVTPRDITCWILPPRIQPGVNPYASPLALLLHLLLHAAGNMLGDSLRLIHLHDIALLASRLGEADWSQLLGMRIQDRAAYWALPPLRLAQRYYPGCVPDEVLRRLSAACPRALSRQAHAQSLSSVSYARLSQALLPGLAWAVSVREQLSYVHRRIYPDAERRASHAVLREQPWAVEACRRPRWRRVLRRLILPLPRAAPMYVVRAAFSQASQAGPAACELTAAPTRS
jgi:hypothetical protein